MTTPAKPVKTRKNIAIDGDLHQALKIAAAQKGIALSVYVEQLLRKGAK